METALGLISDSDVFAHYPETRFSTLFRHYAVVLDTLYQSVTGEQPNSVEYTWYRGEE